MTVAIIVLRVICDRQPRRADGEPTGEHTTTADATQLRAAPVCPVPASDEPELSAGSARIACHGPLD
jgi:hypothetical protein